MAKYIESIKIIHKDDSETLLNPGTKKLVFTGGSLMEVNQEGNEITFTSGSDKGTTDPAIKEKFDAVINGNSLTWPDFSGAPYYFSSLGGVRPDGGHVFLLGNMCVHIGDFAPTSISKCEIPSVTGDSGGALLGILDVCPPCVDCAEYQQLYKYLDKLKNALTEKKDRIFTYTTDTAQQNNIMALLRQATLYWNNMVQQTSWRCSANADGDEINAACMVTNHFDQAIPAGVILGAAFTKLPAGASARGYIIDDVVPSDWILDTDYSLEVSPLDGKTTSVLGANWAGLGTGTIDIEAIGIGTTTIGIGDFISVSSTGDETAFPQDAYSVSNVQIDTPAVGDITFTIDTPDITVGGAGTCDFAETIKLQLTTLSDLEIGESIRLFTATGCPKYEGQDQKAEVSFTNNINTLGAGEFTGFPATKQLTTNKMVVLDVDGLIN